MPGIRTVMVALSPLLGDIIRALTDGFVSLDVIAVIDSLDMLAAQLQALSPELILVALAAADQQRIIDELGGLLPAARILALSPDARLIRLHQPGKLVRTVTDPSAEEFVAAIRGDLDR